MFAAFDGMIVYDRVEVFVTPHLHPHNIKKVVLSFCLKIAQLFINLCSVVIPEHEALVSHGVCEKQ